MKVGLIRNCLTAALRGALALLASIPALRATPADAIQVSVQSVHIVPNIRTGERHAECHLALSGPAAQRVVAARVVLSRVRDNVGTEMKQTGTASFYATSVGGKSEPFGGDSLAFTANPLGKDATRLESVEGRIELFMPDKDPNALLVVDFLPRQFGHRIDAPALKAAGVTLVVYDKASTEGYRLADGDDAPQQFDAGPWFIAWPRREPLFPDLPAAVQKSMMETMSAHAEEMPATMIAVGIKDPNARLLPVEFLDKSGVPLDYNRGGSYHSSSGSSDGKRFDGYDLRRPFPADGKLRAWIMTDRSLSSIPLTLTDVSLPAK